MGEVYRAHDTRLGRDVAIKVLSNAFTADVDRLARFEREARIVAARSRPAGSCRRFRQEAFRSEAEIAKLPGVRVIEAADVAPGPTSDIYAYSRITTQRNLYRIPIP
jgi:serine/threonine protein kinase